MNIVSTDLLPIPTALADLPSAFIEPYGRVVTHTDVAKAFRTSPITLRTWRAREGFPAAENADQKGRYTPYYKVEKLVSEYYKRFPGELPDADESAIYRLFAVAVENKPSEPGENGSASESVAKRVSSETPAFSLKEAFRKELTTLLGDAVAGLLEREPESPAVIETLAAEMAVQREEIEQLRKHVSMTEAALREAEARETEALRWRDKPVLDRLLGR